VNDIVQAVVEITGGGIGGSGTTNYVSKFTASGVLGNSLIFDNGTNVGIGTTSPLGSFNVQGTNIAQEGSATNPAGITLGVQSNQPRISLDNGAGAANIAGNQWCIDNSGGTLRFFTGGALKLTLGSTGAATFSSSITLSGNGSQANNTLFTLSNGYMYVDGNTNGLILENNNSSSTRIRLEGADNMQFITAGSERMRITSGGQLYTSNAPVGDWSMRVIGNSTTSQSFGFKVLGGTNANDLAFSVTPQNGSVNYFLVRGDGLLSSPPTYNNTYSNAANMYIGSDGFMGRSTSSLKYKDNVEDYTKGLAEVMQLRAVSYTSKNPSEEGQTFAGLIAEEVHEIGLTEFVQYAEDGTPDALAYSNMIALLTKAIQELSKQNEELSNRLIKLESK
jgi:hypothetical protein